MTAPLDDTADPFLLLSDLVRHPGADRVALELAIRAGKLTLITRHGRLWVLRADAADWLSWRASVTSGSAPVHQLEL